MSDRDEFYRRFSKSYDKLHQSEMQDDLVERVARAIWMADAEPILPEDRIPWEVIGGPMKNQCYAEARAAITLALEEAADAVGVIGDHADAGAYINAIRALIPQE